VKQEIPILIARIEKGIDVEKSQNKFFKVLSKLKYIDKIVIQKIDIIRNSMRLKEDKFIFKEKVIII